MFPGPQQRSRIFGFFYFSTILETDHRNGCRYVMVKIYPSIYLQVCPRSEMLFVFEDPLFRIVSFT